MRVDRGGHVVERGFQAERVHSFGDDFRGERADRMHAENFAVLRFGDDFDEAVVRAENRRLAVSEERKFSSFHVVTGVARLFFGEAYGADLRLAICGGRAAQPVEGLHVFSGHAADGDDSLHRRGVRQLRQSGDDIADGVEIRFGGFHVGIGMDESALDFGPRFFEPAIFSERAASDGDQDFFGRQVLRFSGLVLESDGRALRIFFYGLDFSSRFDADAFFLEGFFELRRNFLVFQRHDSPQRLEDRHFRTESAIDRCEFHSDRTGADDPQRFRNRGQLQNFAVTQDAAGIKLDAGQRTRFRTRGEHCVRRFQLRGRTIFFNRDASWTGNATPTGDRIDFVFLEQHADAASVFLDDFVLACEHRRPVDLHILHFEAEFLGALEIVVNVGVVQEYFGGYTAHVQAGAAEKWVFFNDSGLQSPLTR